MILLVFEGIAKTNTTHTGLICPCTSLLFEGIAKTNTTHTLPQPFAPKTMFEGIAKTNTTHTFILSSRRCQCLRVLLKQIQHTQDVGSKHRK